MTSLWQDVRVGWRTIRRRPVVTVVAVLSLVVGISMSAVVFSLLDASAVLSSLAIWKDSAHAGARAEPPRTRQRQSQLLVSRLHGLSGRATRLRRSPSRTAARN